MHELGADVNLVVCQKSKLQDWINHFNDYYDLHIYDLTKHLDEFLAECEPKVGIINYDLIWRRKKISKLKDFTLMLDESSLIQHENTNRTKCIMGMNPKNVILLSGTPTGGKYELLLSQMHLLGWKIKEDLFWNQYVDWEWNETTDGYWERKILGYKNVERLKRKMREHGCIFLKTDEVMDLPEQIHQTIKVPISKDYKTFKKEDYIEIDGVELAGDCTLTKLLYERQICGLYSTDKLNAFADLIESTEDRIIVFYNFTAEMERLKAIASELGKTCGVVNGEVKEQNIIEQDGAILFVQYQAGAMGLNLQKANKIIYYTPPLSSELFEQSKKRIHRIGQKNTCFYYYLTMDNTVEVSIYNLLAKRKDYTEDLFKQERL